MNTKFTPEFIASQRAIWVGYSSALDEIDRLQKELAKRDEIIKKYEQVLDERNITERNKTPTIQEIEKYTRALDERNALIEK